MSWRGMSINAKKSCCMRVGPRWYALSTHVTTTCRKQLPWVTELRYLGIRIVQSRRFNGDLHEHKKSFSRLANAISEKLAAWQKKKSLFNLFSPSVGYACITVRHYTSHSLDRL